MGLGGTASGSRRGGARKDREEKDVRAQKAIEEELEYSELRNEMAQCRDPNSQLEVD